MPAQDEGERVEDAEGGSTTCTVSTRGKDKWSQWLQQSQAAGRCTALVEYQSTTIRALQEGTYHRCALPTSC